VQAKRQSGQQFLFVELVIVNDQSQFNENGNLEDTVIRALNIANQMDTVSHTTTYAYTSSTVLFLTEHTA
jgi:hypothetical protein